MYRCRTSCCSLFHLPITLALRLQLLIHLLLFNVTAPPDLPPNAIPNGTYTRPDGTIVDRLALLNLPSFSCSTARLPKIARTHLALSPSSPLPTPSDENFNSIHRTSSKVVPTLIISYRNLLRTTSAPLSSPSSPRLGRYIIPEQRAEEEERVVYSHTTIPEAKVVMKPKTVVVQTPKTIMQDHTFTVQEPRTIMESKRIMVDKVIEEDQIIQVPVPREVQVPVQRMVPKTIMVPVTTYVTQYIQEVEQRTIKVPRTVQEEQVIQVPREIMEDKVCLVSSLHHHQIKPLYFPLALVPAFPYTELPPQRSVPQNMTCVSNQISTPLTGILCSHLGRSTLCSGQRSSWSPRRSWSSSRRPSPSQEPSPSRRLSRATR